MSAEPPGAELHIDTLTVGPLATHAYLLTSGGAAVLVDPGADAPLLLEALRARGAALDAVWLTHAHPDHVGAVAAVLAAAAVPVYLHPLDRPWLEGAAQAAAAWGWRIEPPRCDPRPLADDQQLWLGDQPVRCLHVPGHTPGHVAFHLPRAGVVVAGDTLFRGGIGRTDLPEGDHATLLDSIRARLLPLPPETVVLPGHGPATRIGWERAHNPFLADDDGPHPTSPQRTTPRR